MATAKKQKTVKRKGPGQPTKYKPEYADQARKLCLVLGATDDALADFFEVNVDTIHSWKKRHPEFKAKLTEGKTHADMEIGSSLFERAKGFYVNEQQAVKIRNATGKGEFTEEVKLVEVTRFVPPDTTAQIFWMKNRQKTTWRDRHEIDANIRKDDWGNLEMEF